MGGQAFAGPRGQFFLLKPEELTLITDTKHFLYDPRVDLPIDEGMVQSIMAFGVKEPILVCKDGPNTLVVDGLQRVKNATVANRRLVAAHKEPILIKAIIEKGSEEDLYGIKVLANECRQDDSPVAKAEKAKRYIAMGRSEAQAAVVFGTSVQGIKQLLCLFDLTASARKAVNDGVLSLSAAQHLAKLDREKQGKELERLVAGSATKGKKKGKVTVRAVKAASGRQPPTRKEIQGLIEAGRLSEDARLALIWVLTGDRLGAVLKAFSVPEKVVEVPPMRSPEPSEATTPVHPGAQA
jgi:ParB family chromosome partitioning protein